MIGCSKCKEYKAASEFHKGKEQCKSCRKATAQAYYLKNRDKILRAAAEYQSLNPEVSRKKARKFYKGNGKQKHKEWAKKNRPKMRVTEEKYRLKNLVKFRIKESHRRALKNNSAGSYTSLDIKEILKLQKSKCACPCRRSLAAGYHVDHILPLSKGGSNDRKNIQLLYPSCNMSKGAKDPIVFMQSMGMLL